MRHIYKYSQVSLFSTVCPSESGERQGDGRRMRNPEHVNSVKSLITCITPVLRAFLDFFPDILSFQHVPHFDVGRRCGLRFEAQPIGAHAY